MKYEHLETSRDSSRAVIPPVLMAELRAAIDQALSNERDPEALKRAADRMDRMREELR